MPVRAITAITFSTLITIIIPGEAVEGTVEWDLLEQLEDLEAVDSREVVVMEVVVGQREAASMGLKRREVLLKSGLRVGARTKGK